MYDANVNDEMKTCIFVAKKVRLSGKHAAEEQSGGMVNLTMRKQRELRNNQIHEGNR